jgi:hypothetical protein
MQSPPFGVLLADGHIDVTQQITQSKQRYSRISQQGGRNRSIESTNPEVAEEKTI